MLISSFENNRSLFPQCNTVSVIYKNECLQLAHSYQQAHNSFLFVITLYLRQRLEVSLKLKVGFSLKQVCKL